MNVTADLKAILLDMDGVVIDSEPIHEKAQRIVFRDHDLDVPESEFPAFKGMTERMVFERILLKYGSNHHEIDALVDAKERVYRSLLDELEPVPGALEFIRRASKRYRLALTTSSIRRNQELAFRKFGLDSYFEAVVTEEDITNPKPHPQPYLVTARKLDVEPGVCLVVEDSLHGVRSAHTAGCTVAGITTSFEADLLAEAGAHLVVDTFDELSRQLAL